MFDCISAASLLTLCLPVTSADNLGEQFGPRSGPTNRRAWSGSKLFDILMVFLKEFFQKIILKKISRRQKSMKNYPVGNELIRFDCISYRWSETAESSKETVKSEKIDDTKSDASSESKSSTTEKSKLNPPPTKRSRYDLPALFTHLWGMDFLIHINWMSPFSF